MQRSLIPRFLHPLFLLSLLSLSLPLLQAEAPRVLPDGQKPADTRLQPLKDLNGYFPFTPKPSPQAWEKRAEELRTQLLVTLGLWPMPLPTPLNPVIHGRIDQGDYTVDKVYFESFPGFYVTGNLYRPKNAARPGPGILSPHGHWSGGRFYDQGVQSVRREIVEGAERFENGGRSPLQARSAQLARMGCTVFLYDMLGYADSQQISDVAHRFSEPRPEMISTNNWGLFSPQAESHFQNVMGLQTYNSIRALDFLLTLPEVDPDRLAVTGASGGATQTFILGAIDPRPAVIVPAVMVSTAMQGGCTCENTCGLRIDTGNVEIAALFAPKPMALTAADDWTREMSTKGFPQLQQHYAMLGAPDHVALKPLLHFGHNYNYVSRAFMYSWMNRHLQLGLPEPIVEEDYPRLSTAEMTVFDDDHPRPPGGPDFERALLAHWHQETQHQLDPDQLTPQQFRQAVGAGLNLVIGRNLNTAGNVAFELTGKTDHGGYLEMPGLLQNETYNEEIPAVFLHPKDWNGTTVIWPHENGKNGLYSDRGTPIPAVEKLLEQGTTVMALDLLFQGEFLDPGQEWDQTRKVENPRMFAGFTFGYNHTLFARRVHDLLSAVKFVQDHERTSTRLQLIGLGRAGAWVAAARALSGSAVHDAAIDTAGFRFIQLMDWRDPSFLPGASKYHDLPGFLALAAPHPVWIAGEGAALPDITRKVYAKNNAIHQATLFTGSNEQAPAAATDWLLNQTAP